MSIINIVIKLLNKIIYKIRCKFAGKQGSKVYWSVHMVNHQSFNSVDDSLNHFHWRNIQYPGYIELMPVTGINDKVILDYGCGPGNDLVGFSVYSKPSKLIAADVSKPALDFAKKRLELHGKSAELIHINDKNNTIPLASNSVDYIHSSGVLHHCSNLDAVLIELYRILKNDGEISVMIYNYQSIWIHLYVAWFYQLKKNKYKNLSLLEAFRRTTDGQNCPISNCYKPEQFINIVENAGFSIKLRGISISITELKVMHRRFDAIQDLRLDKEHTQFLSTLTFDEKGIPYYQGNVAGIGACYTLKKN